MALTDPLGIDTADCNGPVNLSAEPKIQFAAARVGVGIHYRDAEYGNTRAQAERLGIPFIAYHVLVPGYSPAEQAACFRSWAGADCWGYSWDCEVSNGLRPALVSACTRDALAVMDEYGLRQIPYSSPGWINEYFRNPITHLLPDWINDYWWWLAQYLASGAEHPGPVYVPVGMERNRVLIHQSNSQEPNHYGSLYDSKFVDVDRALIWPFPGWKGGTPAVIPAPETQPAEAVKTVMTVVCSGLYIRTKPAAGETPKLGIILRGGQVNVVKTIAVGRDVWVQRAEGGYCAAKYQGYTYLR